MLEIHATLRSKTDKLDQLRTNGMVPAVVYGAKTEATAISTDARALAKIWKQAGETTPVEIHLDGAKKHAMIHEVQVHPVKGHILHVDFLVVDMNKPVEVAMPLEFTGVAPAEKGNLGTLVKVLHEVEISALPKDLPHSIEVSLEGLTAVHDQIHVSDIKLPKGVTMISDLEEVVALIAPMSEEEPAESTPMDLSAIEVEKKGKKEEVETE